MHHQCLARGRRSRHQAFKTAPCHALTRPTSNVSFHASMNTLFEVTKDGFTISTDPARLDFDAIHGYLQRSYWSPAVPRGVVERAAANSLCFGVYNREEQVGYARVITDFTVIAYLADVFILESYQGRGLGKWLVQTMLAHPELQFVRKWMLFTRDAHGLYEQFGFTRIPNVENRSLERRAAEPWPDPLPFDPDPALSKAEP
jgi:GNAT superfamily N-acetyltransferase